MLVKIYLPIFFQVSTDLHTSKFDATVAIATFAPGCKLSANLFFRPVHVNDYFINIGLNLAADLTCKFSCYSEEFFCGSADINSQFNFDLIVECNFLRSTKL